METHYQTNQHRLKRLWLYLGGACFILVLEVVMWIIDLATAPPRDEAKAATASAEACRA